MIHNKDFLLWCAALLVGAALGLLTWQCGLRASRYPRDSDLPLVALSLGRLACTVELAEGSPREIQMTRAAVAAVESALNGKGPPFSAAMLSLFPERVRPYIVLVLIESSVWTPRQVAERVMAFIVGCREVLTLRQVGESAWSGEQSGRQSKRLR